MSHYLSVGFDINRFSTGCTCTSPGFSVGVNLIFQIRKSPKPNKLWLDTRGIPTQNITINARCSTAQ